MSVFTRARHAACCAMVLILGISPTCADDAEKQEDGKAVTLETRKQIVNQLLNVVRNPEESVETRASAARSLGTQTSDIEKGKTEVREALLAIIKAQNAEPDLQIAAIAGLRESGVQLSEDQLKVIGDVLWGIVIDNADEEESQISVVAVHDLIQYENAGYPLPPDDVAAVHALLAINLKRDSQFSYQGERYSSESSSSEMLLRFNDSERRVRFLIEALNSLEGKPLASGERLKLVGILEDTIPKNEGIARVLLKAASHENPDIRAAAIEALGNEIPESDEGAALITPPAPE